MGPNPSGDGQVVWVLSDVADCGGGGSIISATPESGLGLLFCLGNPTGGDESTLDACNATVAAINALGSPQICCPETMPADSRANQPKVDRCDPTGTCQADPVNMGDGKVVLDRTDAVLRTRAGDLSFKRFFNSGGLELPAVYLFTLGVEYHFVTDPFYFYETDPIAHFYDPLRLMPLPFGPSGQGHPLEWRHGFFSFITVGAEDAAAYVLDTEGVVLGFNCRGTVRPMAPAGLRPLLSCLA